LPIEHRLHPDDDRSRRALFRTLSSGRYFPGVIGAISLILAFYSFQTLPVNYAGLLLIAVAIILFIIEVKGGQPRAAFYWGVISLTLGSIMLFEDLRFLSN